MTRQDSESHSIDEALRERFEACWLSGNPEGIEQCLPPEDSPSYLATLEELVQIDLEFAWKALSRSQADMDTMAVDETIRSTAMTERYLERFPVLDEPTTVLRLLKQEYFVRSRFSHPPSIDEYQRRFPKLSLDGDVLNSSEFFLSRASEDELDAVLNRRTRQTPLEGTRLGDYEILDELGCGGMGVVFRAHQQSADRIVALKVIRDEYLAGLKADARQRTMDRFRTEAQATAKLDHENIVPVYEVGEADGRRFYSMRLVAGVSLTESLSRGPLEPQLAATYIEAAARGVHEAHQHGILHRDLKPHNILFDAHRNCAMVTDFGLAKLIDSEQELTKSGEVMGTPSYMSPEQARDAGCATALSDVYSLGATLYHLLTGRPPFQAATPVETLRQVNDEEPLPPKQLNPAIDRDLETIESCVTTPWVVTIWQH